VSNADLQGLKDLGKAAYAPIGRCIYCGRTEDLRREHIVPFGLSGTAVLPKSTCGDCAEITSRFEAEVLRGPMRAVRVLRALRSRSKHKGAPKTERLTVLRGGETQTVELPLEQYPILLHFPLFPPPAFLSSAGCRSGIRMSGVVSVLFRPRPEDVLRQLGAEKILLGPQNYRPVAFARMIAKIAYGMAVAEGSIDALDGKPLLLDAILGGKDEIGRWVGTLTKPIERFKGLLHRILVHEDREKGLLIGEVQLFADSETPSYGVIIGKLK